MKGFVQGADRQQTTLLPECLDDWVDESNPVRAVDVFVDALELRELDFDGVGHRQRPAGRDIIRRRCSSFTSTAISTEFNSSRRLEREAGRNLEVMWLTGRLVPDHKTIADFRKDNGPAIKKVCAQFVTLCRKMGLLAKASVAIDGSKFKAVNSRDNNFTKGRMERRLAQIEESVERYLSQLDTADRQTAAGEAPSEELVARTARLKEKLIKLEEEVKRLKAIEKQMLAAPDQQVSFTDPDSRSMATSGRGSGMVGYNVQAAVDTTNRLIVAHEVTRSAPTSRILRTWPTKRRRHWRRKTSKPSPIAATSKARRSSHAKRLASRSRCQNLKHRMRSRKAASANRTSATWLRRTSTFVLPVRSSPATSRTRKMDWPHDYWTNACRTCALKAQCTKGPQRRIKRWEDEYVVDAVQARLDRNPDAMRTRRETVEHPFGTLKMRMGATHFLMKTLPKVATEMALHVLAYNLTRVMNIVGIKPLLAAIRA